MRDDHRKQGWMFVNFVAMLVYYRLYSELISKNLLRKYSPQDVIVHLSRIQKLLIGEKWVLSEIPRRPEKSLRSVQTYGAKIDRVRA